jgi:hypothetical protein
MKLIIKGKLKAGSQVDAGKYEGHLYKGLITEINEKFITVKFSDRDIITVPITEVMICTNRKANIGNTIL